MYLYDNQRPIGNQGAGFLFIALMISLLYIIGTSNIINICLPQFGKFPIGIV
jgi:hypothetical protein